MHYKPHFLGLVLACFSWGIANAQGTQPPADYEAKIDRLFDENENLRKERNNLEKELSAVRKLLEEAASEPAVLEETSDVERKRLADTLESAEKLIQQLKQVDVERVETERKLQAAEAEGQKQQLMDVSSKIAPTDAKQLACDAEEEGNCSSEKTQDCVDIIDSDVSGVVATLHVMNACRKNSQLSVRLRARSPLPSRMTALFDDNGLATLVFPVLEDNVTVRVLGADEKSYEELSLSPIAGYNNDFVILRWEGESVDLDLLAKLPGNGAESALTATNPETSFGALILAQADSTPQQPHFELFEAKRGAPTLQIGVIHSSRGDVASKPYCDDMAAAAPAFLLLIHDSNGFQQVHDSIQSVACDKNVSAEDQYSLINQFKARW